MLGQEDLVEIAGMLLEPGKKQPSMATFWNEGLEIFLKSEAT